MKEQVTIHGFEKICSLKEQRLVYHGDVESQRAYNAELQRTNDLLKDREERLLRIRDLENATQNRIHAVGQRMQQSYMPQVQNGQVIYPRVITQRSAYSTPTYRPTEYPMPPTAPARRAGARYQSFTPQGRQYQGYREPRGHAPSGRPLSRNEHQLKMIHREHAGAPGSSNHYYIPGENDGKYRQGNSGGYSSGYDAPRYTVLPRTPTERERKTQEQDRLTEFYADQLEHRDLPRLLDGIKSPYGKQKGEEILDNMERNMRKNPNKREYYYQLARARTLLEEIRRTEDQRSALEGNGRSPYDQVQGKEAYVNGEKADNNEVLIGVDVTDPYKTIVITTPPDRYGKRGEILYSPNMDRVLRYNARGGVNAMLDHQIYIEKDKNYDGSVRGIKIKFGKEGTYNVDGRQVVVGTNPDVQNNPESQKPILRTLDINAGFDVKRLYVIKAGKPNIPIDVSRLKNGQKLSWEDGISIERTNEGKLKVHFREQGTFDVVAGNGREGQLKLGRYEVGGGMPSLRQNPNPTPTPESQPQPQPQPTPSPTPTPAPIPRPTPSPSSAPRNNEDEIREKLSLWRVLPNDNNIKQFIDRASTRLDYARYEHSIPESYQNAFQNVKTLSAENVPSSDHKVYKIKFTVNNEQWGARVQGDRVILQNDSNPLESVVFDAVSNRLTQELIEEKIQQAKGLYKLEQNDPADMKNFDIAKSAERVGYIELRDSTDQNLTGKVYREIYPQILAKRYNVYQHPDGRIDAESSQDAENKLSTRMSEMYDLGIKNFYFDINTHGQEDGIEIDGQKIEPAFFTKMFTKYLDCKFTLNTIACFGGGMTNAMREFQELHKDGRVTVITQTKNDVTNTAKPVRQSLIKGQYTDYDTVYNSALVKYLMEQKQSWAKEPKFTYGEAHLLADKEAKLLTGNDAEVVRSGKNGSEYTADSSQDFRTENQV